MSEATPTWDNSTPIDTTSAPTPTPAVSHDEATPTWDNSVDPEDKYGGPTGMLAAFTGHVANANIPGLTRVLGQDPETTNALTEQNPISSAAGDIVGFTRAASLGVGVPGLISKAGTAVGGILPGLAGKALQFGTEGALMGVAQSDNETALGDPNLTAQKVLSNIGWGAALGVGAAPIAEAAETILPSATKKLSSALSNLKESVMGTAEEPSPVSKVIANVSSLTNKYTAADNLTALRAGLDAGETTLPKITKNIDEVFEHGTKVSDELSSSLNKEIETSTLPEPEQVEADLKTKEMLFDYQKSADEFRSAFMGDKKDALDPSKISNLFNNLGKPEFEAQRAALDNYIEQTKRVLNASENYANYKEAETSISKLVNSIVSKNASAKEVLTAMVNKPKGGGLLKDAAIGTALKMAGASNPIVGTAITAAEMYRAVANPYELGKTLNSSFQKIKAIAEISEKVTDKMSSLAKSVFSNPGVRSEATKQLPPIASQNGYDKKASRINELASNPQALQDHLAMHTEDLYQDAPMVSSGLHNAMIAGVQFLSSKLPRPQQELPLSQEWQPSNSQKQTFMNYYRAVSEPFSALKDIKKGTLSDQTMEALQATQPHLLQEMRSKVAESLNPKKAKNLPYYVKISLSKFMGQPMVAEMLPQVIMSNQMSFIGPQQSQQNAPEQKRASSSGMKSLSLANRAETETQEHEKEEV